ncbi:male sterility protein-domain-containing protein, partial [Amylostereum chailletii]
AALLKERQVRAFETYDLDAGLLDASPGKVELLICNLADDNLGLSEAVYREIQQSVTVIINNAWALNFKAPLVKFEPLLKGSRNLTHLSLSSPRSPPPLLAFVSTVLVWWTRPRPPVSSADHPSGKPKPETLIADPRIAVHSGYSESKWIAETLLARLASSHGLPTTIIRLGQLIGDSKTGSWNTDEWIPAIIKLAQDPHIRSVPLLTQVRPSPLCASPAPILASQALAQ